MEEQTKTNINLKDLVLSTYENIESRYIRKDECYGISTSIEEYDFITNGLHNSELTIIASRHSMGKTSFAMTILNNLCIKNTIPVLFISYEMNDTIFIERLLSLVSEVDSQRIKQGNVYTKDWEKIADGMAKLADISDKSLLTVIPACQLNSNELFDEIRQFATNHPDGAVFVDYFQLIKLIGKNDRITELASVAAEFKRLATELNIPIIVLSQVSKITRERTDLRPSLEELAECDALAQHADNVIFLYRESYYNPEIKYEKTDINPNTTEIIIAKQKNGLTGKFNMIFKPDIFKFVD